MRSLIFLIFTCFTTFLFSQELDPVKWSFDSNQVGPDEFELIFKADYDDPWKVYSQYTGDDGPRPTEINFESNNFEKIGLGIETGAKKEGYDKMFETNVVAFAAKKPYVIKQRVKITDLSKPVKGYLTYMTCNNEMCLPPTDVDFSFKFNFNAPKKVDKSSKTLPIPVPDEMKKSKELIKNTGETKTEIPSKVETAVKKTIDPKAQARLETKAETKLETKTETKANSGVGDISIAPISIGGIENDETEDDSGMKDPIAWTFDIKQKADVYILEFVADIDEGWTVYSQFSSDEGPVPTSLNFETEGFEIVGKALENGYRKQGPDPLFDNVEVIKYLSDEQFIIRQKVKSYSKEEIKGYLTYMACNSEGCLPPSDVDFGFDIKNLKTFVPGLASSLGNDVNPFDGTNAVDQKIASVVETYATPVGNCKGGEEEEDRGLLMSLIFGFLAGLVALLTPCVFPMIPLTVSFFTKDTKRKGWVNGAIYAASIIVIYVTLGLLLTALVGPDALNRLSTNWISNTLFFLIFVVFAFSFFGYFEITLPSSWSTKTDSMADKGGLIGTFFMAFTLALVSFSCTGPLIGSAIVSAASNAIGPAAVMLGFGAGLALPFGLFAAFPSWLNSLPQSGGWMTSVKVVLGFLELALALKFLSVADMTSHWGFLRYELFMGLWVIIFFLTALYLFGFIRFPHDSKLKKLSVGRGLLGGAFALFTLYLASGFMINEKTGNYKALSLMSGLAPPAHYNFFIPPKEVDATIKAKYPSYTMCANNIPCFKDYYEGKSYAKEVNKMMFLDFTGHGCVNCRKVEEHIWVRDEIRDKLINECVLISLYVDDDKKYPETKLSVRDDYKIRNVGNKWTDFQISNFKQNTQPLYVMMTLDEEVIAKPRGYRPNEGVKEYEEYMQCGLNKFAE